MKSVKYLKGSNVICKVTGTKGIVISYEIINGKVIYKVSTYPEHKIITIPESRLK